MSSVTLVLACSPALMIVGLNTVAFSRVVQGKLFLDKRNCDVLSELAESIYIYMTAGSMHVMQEQV